MVATRRASSNRMRRTSLRPPSSSAFAFASIQPVMLVSAGPPCGGFKYNPPHGGPAETSITGWIEAKANALLEGGLKDVRRIRFDDARRVATIREHDFLEAYISDLGSVIDFHGMRASGIRMGVVPLGGAGVH